jgi:ABC-type nitrate/sulfonate/bicarbonate transport system substrate-binding protein
MLLDKYGIPRDSVTFIDGGFTADSLLANAQNSNVGAEYYTGWVMNQPRQLEDAGYAWNGLRYKDWVYNEYSDTIAVRNETLQTEEGRDMVRRFLRATYRGVQYMVNNPEQSAEIAVIYSVDIPLTKEQAMWRFQAQLNLVLGDTPRLMEMSSEHWNTMTATLVQYGQMEVMSPK